MTYAEFKKELKENIVALDELSQYKIVAHYDEAYQTKTAEGASEEAIVESFGSISEAIDKAMILLGIEKAETAKEEEKKEEKAEEKKDSVASKTADYAKDTADDFKKDLSREAKSEVKKTTSKAASNIVDGVSGFFGGLFKKK